MYILFPSSYLNSRKVDEAFQKEYYAAMEEGCCPVLFNQRVWDEKKIVILNTLINTERPVLYRGWMMKPEEYELFYDSLQTKIISNPGITLITSPEEYKKMHAFPNIYEQVKEDTPKIMTFPLYAQIDIKEIQKNLGTFIIKDFVKSAKNTDFPVFFDKTVTQETFDKWMSRFEEIRGNLLTGGIVAKQYIDLKKYNGYSNEYRVFYCYGNPVSICRNSLQPSYTPEVPKELVEKYKNLPSPFYTVDFAEKADNTWIIIETGDGGVSGLSEGQNYEAFFRAIKITCKKEMKLKRNVLIETEKPNIYRINDNYDTIFVPKDYINKITEGILYITEDNFELAKKTFIKHFNQEIKESEKDIRNIQGSINRSKRNIFLLERMNFTKEKEKITPGMEVVLEDCKAVVLNQTEENMFYVLTENGCVEHWCSDYFTITGKVFHNIPYQNNNMEEQ